MILPGRTPRDPLPPSYNLYCELPLVQDEGGPRVRRGGTHASSNPMFTCDSPLDSFTYDSRPDPCARFGPRRARHPGADPSRQRRCRRRKHYVGEAKPPRPAPAPRSTPLPPAARAALRKRLLQRLEGLKRARLGLTTLEREVQEGSTTLLPLLPPGLFLDDDDVVSTSSIFAAWQSSSNLPILSSSTGPRDADAGGGDNSSSNHGGDAPHAHLHHRDGHHHEHYARCSGCASPASASHPCSPTLRTSAAAGDDDDGYDADDDHEHDDDDTNDNDDDDDSSSTITTFAVPAHPPFSLSSTSRISLPTSSFRPCFMTLMRRRIDLDVQTSDTIENVKEMIEGEEGIPANVQRLIFAGTQLEDGMTLLECGTRFDSVIHVVLGLAAGGGEDGVGDKVGKGLGHPHDSNDDTITTNPTRQSCTAPCWRLSFRLSRAPALEEAHHHRQRRRRRRGLHSQRSDCPWGSKHKRLPQRCPTHDTSLYLHNTHIRIHTKIGSTPAHHDRGPDEEEHVDMEAGSEGDEGDDESEVGATHG